MMSVAISCIGTSLLSFLLSLLLLSLPQHLLPSLLPRVLRVHRFCYWVGWKVCISGLEGSGCKDWGAGVQGLGWVWGEDPRTEKRSYQVMSVAISCIGTTCVSADARDSISHASAPPTFLNSNSDKILKEKFAVKPVVKSVKTVVILLMGRGSGRLYY